MPDLQRMRADFGTFCRELGWPLEPFQERSMQLHKRTTVDVAPRQSGKSECLGKLAVWRAFSEPEHRVLIVSAGEEASRRLLGIARRLVQHPVLAGSVVDEFAGLLTLSNGSEIRSVPASERQVRGWSVDTLLCDEAALIPDDLLLGAAIPTTAARPDARIVLASSATTASGAFYDHAKLGEAGSEYVETFRWSLTDCPWISASSIEAARESMSELRFAAEYEGVFAGSSDALFPRHVLDRATVDYAPDALEEMLGPSRTLAGVDWGAVRDRSALVAIGRLPLADSRRVFAVRCAKRWPEGHLLHKVVEEIARSEGEFARISAEANGIGAPLVQQLFAALYRRPFDRGGGARAPVVWAVVEDVPKLPWEAPGERLKAPRRRERGAGYVTDKRAVHTTAALKAACYSSLRLRIDRGELILPADAQDLIRELLMLRVDLTASGTERIEATSGSFDDLPDALLMASQPYRYHGEWKTWLDRLCDPATRLPEPPIPPAVFAQECVAGPDGMQVPRRPAWITPESDQVTLPAGMDLTDPTVRARREAVRAAISHSERRELVERVR
jgi:hypothetical protein